MVVYLEVCNYAYECLGRARQVSTQVGMLEDKKNQL